MGVAAEQGQSWTATDKALEKAAYDKIDAQLDAKRRYRDDTESNVLGSEYTSYRRGGARDKWEEEQKDKKDASGYEDLEQLLIMSRAKRLANP